MIKKLLLLYIFLQSTVCYAEIIKTDVLVIGGSAGGVAAAIQSSRSKVKTLLVEQGPKLGSNLCEGAICILDANRNFESGIWAEFRRHVRNFYKNTAGYDTANNAALRFEAYTGAAILKKITDTVKNLTVKLNTPVTAIKSDGTGWQVTITINNKSITIKARVVIDATEGSDIAAMAGAKFNTGAGSRTWMEDDDIYTPYTRSLKLYRTGIAVGDALPGQKYSDGMALPFPAYTIPLGAIIVSDLENFLVTGKALSVTPQVNASIANPAVQMTLGQGVGATAAFLAFFKTTTKNLNVRMIQGEILDYKGYIFAIADIPFTDTYFRAVQQVCATGLLKGVQKVEGNRTLVLFRPDSVVYTADIKPVLTELYTRTFLWFNKTKPGEKFTVGDLLSFISEITLADPENLQLSMQKNWKTTYKFKTGFDLNRPLTRYEFAALANKFLNPFARRVDLTGKVVN